MWIGWLRRVLGSLLMVSMAGLTSTASAMVINGDFETGDFSGWSFFVTEYGGIGTPSVVPFDTNGDSIASNAARFNVGQVGGPCGIGGGCPRQGGGIQQNFVTDSGLLLIDVDIAAESEGNNADGGLFTLFLDDVVLDSVDFGDIGPSIDGPIERGTLAASTVVSAGSHELRIQIERGFAETTFVNSYVDNVTVIPEPTTLSLLTLGLIGVVLRKRICGVERG